MGMSASELAETLINLGCVDAVSCDGGGSSTFLSKREGGDLTVKNVPSDGTERATLGGLLVVSNSVSDSVFDHASVAKAKLLLSLSNVSPTRSRINNVLLRKLLDVCI